jgi:hypothetical protein
MRKLTKIVITLALSLALVIPSTAEARGFSGGSHFSSSSHSSSFSSSRSSGSSSRSSFSTSRSSSSRSFSGSSSRRTSSYSSSKPSVSLTKPSTSTKSSFSGKTSTKSSVSSPTKGSFSGRTSTKSSTVRGRTYTSTPTRTYYNGRYVSVNHYYSAGYSPSGWFGYYHGFTMGMFMGSMFHPWGGVYHPVGGAVAVYGASPIAWVMDIILLIVVIGVIIAIWRAFSPSKSIYRRKF